MQNPTRPEPLRAGSPKRAAPNINSMWKSCGEPKADGIGAIFMRQRQVFSWRMQGGERFREKPGCHDFAENIPLIRHRAVRFGGLDNNPFELLPRRLSP